MWREQLWEVVPPARAARILAGLVAIVVLLAVGPFRPTAQSGVDRGGTDVDQDGRSAEVLGAFAGSSSSLADPDASPASAAESQPTPRSEATPRPADPTPAPTPTPLERITLQGSGSKVTKPFLLAGGRIRVTSTAHTSSSDGCLHVGTFSAKKSGVLPKDRSRRTTIIFLVEAGSGKGWVDVKVPTGWYFMEIESDCSWVVKIGPR